MYKCPKCGSTDLSVTHCVVDGEMPLREDGFIIGGDTSYEMVLCKECDYQADLGEFVEQEEKEKLLRSIEDVVQFCKERIKTIIENDIVTALQNAGHEPNDIPQFALEGEYNEEVMEKASGYAHECDIEERDGYTTATGEVSALLYVLCKLGFPKTVADRNLQRWAEAFQNWF